MLVDELFLQNHLHGSDDLSHDDQEVSCRAAQRGRVGFREFSSRNGNITHIVLFAVLACCNLILPWK